MLADFTEVGQRVVLLEGGMGGRGNASYTTSTNRAPRQHQPGIPAQEMAVWLRLKLLADAGLVGLPNAGKSTFINQVSNAGAKVGDYAFTTLVPKLGVVRHRDREFVLADIPGLIEGAAEGAGIGDRFLGHIERCRVLIHLVDIAGADPAEAMQVVEARARRLWRRPRRQAAADRAQQDRPRRRRARGGLSPRSCARRGPSGCSRSRARPAPGIPALLDAVLDAPARAHRDREPRAPRCRTRTSPRRSWSPLG